MTEEKKHEIAIACVINRESEKIIAYEGREILLEQDYDTGQFLTCSDKILVDICLCCCGIGVCIYDCYLLPKHTKKAIIDILPEFREKIIDELYSKYEWNKDNIRLSLIFAHEKSSYMESIFAAESFRSIGYGTFYKVRNEVSSLENPFLTPTPR